MPMMHVNAQLLANFYLQIKNGVHQIQPISYWSEMEAYHLNNIFTMYAAGQLLWNPERDPHEILGEMAQGIWGPRNGPVILAALELIQGTHSGPTWETYWWTLPTHRLGTEKPEEDLRRAENALAALVKMKTDAQFVPKFPLPFPPATFVELILPHLEQIKQFARFRIEVAKIRESVLLRAPSAPSPDRNSPGSPLSVHTSAGYSFGLASPRSEERRVREEGRHSGT